MRHLSPDAARHGNYPGLTLPRVPGHEVVGRIEALGRGCPDGKSASGWRRPIAEKTAYANRVDEEHREIVRTP